MTTHADALAIANDLDHFVSWTKERLDVWIDDGSEPLQIYRQYLLYYGIVLKTDSESFLDTNCGQITLSSETYLFLVTIKAGLVDDEFFSEANEIESVAVILSAWNDVKANRARIAAYHESKAARNGN